MQQSRMTKYHDALLALGLGALTCFVFAGVLDNGFVNLDDDAYVIDNPHVRTGLSLVNVRWAITAFHSANWHPLTWVSHQMDCALFGLNPKGHHATSMCLHAANAALLFLFFRLATGMRWSSLSAAALFAVHPLRVESVAWVAERKDVLSLFFALAAVLAYLWYARRPRVLPYIAAVLMFAASLLSKPMLVTLPCVLLLLDLWPLNRFQCGDAGRIRVLLRLVLEKTPLFTVSAAVALLTLRAQRAAGAVAELTVIPLSTRLANAAISYSAYLGKLVWPYPLAVPYPLNVAEVSGGVALISAAFLVLVTALVIARLRQSPAWTTGWFWYVGTLVPVIGVLQVGSQSMADRYTYFPQIGLVWALAWTVGRMAAPTAPSTQDESPKAAAPDRKTKWIGGACGVCTLAVLAACIILTQRQVQVWRDSETLFRHTLRVTGANSIAHNNLGKHLLEKCLDRGLGQALVSPHPSDKALLQEAFDHLTAAIRISPDNMQARNNLGVAFFLVGQNDLAIQQLSQVDGTAAADAQFYYNYALALRAAKEREKAEAMMRRALELDPDFDEAARVLRQWTKRPDSQ